MSSHSIKFFTDGAIPPNSGILVVFPPTYSTLIITSQLDCHVRLDDGRETNTSACAVEGITLKLETGSFEIPAETYFYIEIEEVPTPPEDGEVNMNDFII